MIFLFYIQRLRYFNSTIRLTARLFARLTIIIQPIISNKKSGLPPIPTNESPWGPGNEFATFPRTLRDRKGEHRRATRTIQHGQCCCVNPPFIRNTFLPSLLHRASSFRERPFRWNIKTRIICLSNREVNHNPRECKIRDGKNERTQRNREREGGGEREERKVLIKQWIIMCVCQGFSLDNKEGMEPGSDTSGFCRLITINSIVDVERRTGGMEERKREKKALSRFPPLLFSSSSRLPTSSDNYSRASSE